MSLRRNGQSRTARLSERVLEDVLPFGMLLKRRLRERAQGNDLQAAGADIHDHVLDQRPADTHAAEFFGNARVVDDQDLLAGFGEGHLRIRLARDAGHIAAPCGLVLARDVDADFLSFRHASLLNRHEAYAGWGPVRRTGFVRFQPLQAGT